MPRRDGTGPLGQGAMTGRGLGFCNVSSVAAHDVPFGRRFAGSFGGFGFRRGRRSRMGFGMSHRLGWRDPQNTQQVLSMRKTRLEQELELIKNELKDLGE